MSFRESTVVIIDTGRSSIKAGQGIYELLRTPTVDIPARVARRKNAPNPRKEGENGAEADPNKPTLRPSSYLVGPQIDEALANGEELDIFWPFEGSNEKTGGVSDWTQAEALWKYVLFTGLKIRRTQNESPVMLSLPATLSRDSHARVAQVFFERLNVAGLSVVERPILQLYAANAISGIVIDIHNTCTDITPIYDSAVQLAATVLAPLGVQHCEAYLAHLLATNSTLVATLGVPPAELRPTLLRLARMLWKNGHIKVPLAGDVAPPEEEDEGVTNIAAVVVAGREKAVVEANNKKKNTKNSTAAERAREAEIAALDLLTVEFEGKQVTVGKDRHRFCEPLFEPSILRNVEGMQETLKDHKSIFGLQEWVNHAAQGVDYVWRHTLYDAVFVTGELSAMDKTLSYAVHSRLLSYVLKAEEPANDAQPKAVRTVRVPDYFAEYREKGDGLAGFLGGSIVAKLTFCDSSARNYVSKNDYSARGPAALLEYMV
ncbi:actin [Ceratobasidium sp. AG-Ba]|nr:actin [Ceratobasidium sp. AG-Ba]